LLCASCLLNVAVAADTTTSTGASSHTSSPVTEPAWCGAAFCTNPVARVQSHQDGIEFLASAVNAPFVGWMFDTSNYPPRWQCGNWSTALGWLHIVSDIAIWLAYLAIPLALVYFARRHDKIPFRNLFWLFSAFIVCCGTTHLMEAIIFWWPAYGLAGVIKLVTAVVSVATVVALVPVVPKALAMRSQTDMDAEIRRQTRDLELARQQAASVIESAPTGMVMIDCHRTIVLVNAMAEKMFGYRRDQMLGQPIEMLLPERYRSAHPDQIAGYLYDPTARRMGAGRDLTALRADGSEFPVEIGLNPVRTAEGLFVLSAIVDLTERQQIEANAEKSAQWLQMVVESAKDHAIIALDPEGNVTSWNVGAERLTGYQADEVLGMHFSCFYTHEAINEGLPARELAKAFQEGSFQDEGLRVRKDGSTFWANVVVSSLRAPNGRLLGFSNITRDLTERRRADDRFKASIEFAPTAMVMVDRRRTIIVVNAMVESLFGYARNELLGQSIEILLPERYRSGHPDKVARYFDSPIARRMGDGRDLSGLRKDGSEFPIEIGLSPVETDEGLFVLSTIVDITTRKQTEAKIQDVINALAQSNSELEQFAYIASHDLQEPLRKISSYCQLLREEQGDRLDEDGLDYLDVAINGAERLRTLVRDLLAFSRITTRGKPVAPTDANKCLAAAIDNLELAIEECGAQITYGHLPIVLADESQLILLFQNLIGNAIKFRGDAPPEVHVSGRRVGSQFEFFVRDNGIGIDPKFEDRIFKIFQRLHNRREYSGTGIGLALCKRIVERCGGRIWIESTPGAGSTFFFCLNYATTNGIFDDRTHELECVGSAN
jgi:PAS domain S-box-containing protein